MIKIFGKIRYHWQPEFSWGIIYWSLTLTPLFIALSLLLEKLKMSILFFMLVGLFFLMCLLGTRRYFELKEDHLRISTANPLKVKKILMKDISRIEVTYLAIRIIVNQNTDGSIYHMRKWPKKYFVNHIALHPEFSGEVVLTDHLIKQDYFEEYYSGKTTSIR
ncbi:EbsA family protein [Streptococcus suis]|nr:EbsA family protein [Streptococcus suis]